MNSFTCQRCSACCRQSGFVYLTEEDVRTFAKYFHVDPYQFTDQYCLLIDRRYLVLKKNKDETCVFLHSEGCSVYEARPAQCRDFPMRWKTEKSLIYCRGLTRKG